MSDVRQVLREANAEAVHRMLAAEPVLIDVVAAADAIPELGEGMILHAGPPISWERMCGPMRGAVASHHGKLERP